MAEVKWKGGTDMGRKRFVFHNICFMLFGLSLYVLIINFHFSTAGSLSIAVVGSMLFFIGSYSLLAGMKEKSGLNKG